MMPIDCEVMPLAEATSPELKALGAALLRWYVRECGGEGLAHSVDTEALIELLNGCMPAARVPGSRPPLSRREQWISHPPRACSTATSCAPDVEELRDALAEARRPAALLRLRGESYDRARQSPACTAICQANSSAMCTWMGGAGIRSKGPHRNNFVNDSPMPVVGWHVLRYSEGRA